MLKDSTMACASALAQLEQTRRRGSLAALALFGVVCLAALLTRPEELRIAWANVGPATAKSSTSLSKASSALKDSANAHWWDRMLGSSSTEEVLAIAKLFNLRVAVAPNPGNAGDSLIVLGMLTAFKTAGLQPTWLHWLDCAPHDSSEPPYDVVFYPGGGNLVSHYPHCARFLANCLRQTTTKRVVLPHSVNQHEDLLRNQTRDVLIITRDKRSFAHVQANNHSGLRAMLDLDMALRVRFDSLPAWLQQLQPRPLADPKSVLCGSRRDVEAAGIPLPCPNGSVKEDVSNLKHIMENKGYIDIDVDGLTIGRYALNFLAHVGQYSRVYTDRLHLCIGASIMGRQAFCGDNSYGKVSAAYEMAKDRLPNVIPLWTPEGLKRHAEIVGNHL